MKKKLFVTIALLALFCACDPPYVMWLHGPGMAVYVFRIKDPAYMEYALMDSLWNSKLEKYDSFGFRSVARRDDRQFFGSMKQAKEGTTLSSSPCEIADAPSVYYPLHEGFYMFHPFTISLHNRYLSTCKWKDLCDVNMDTVQILCPSSEVFEDIYCLTADWAATYLHKRAERLTLEDFVKYANLWIDANKDNIGDRWHSPDGGIGIYPEDDYVWSWE